MWIIELATVAVMIGFNGVFAAYEIALASAGFAQLDQLAREGRRGANSALRMKRRIEASLTVVQLGITLVGAVAAATGGVGAAESIAPYLDEAGVAAPYSRLLALTMVVLPLTVVTIVFGELVPKVIALRNRETICLRLSPPMEWFARAVWPVVWLLESLVSLVVRLVVRRRKGEAETISEVTAFQELRSIAALARTWRIIGQREEGIIVGAARLPSTPVREILLPVEHISMLTADAPPDGALDAACQDMHTRFPVTEAAGDPQWIIGYVNFKDVVAQARSTSENGTLADIVRPLPEFTEEETVATCLETLIRRHHHIALIRDRERRVVGMITMEDVLEELVGEIHDEYDRLPSHLNRVRDGWIAGGNVTLERLRAETDIVLSPSDERPVHTINDWLAVRGDRPARRGDTVDLGDWQLQVRKVRRQLVQEVRLTKRS
ncbi:MAG: hemolysin family protein [Pirellulaceae bacterium]